MSKKENIFIKYQKEICLYSFIFLVMLILNRSNVLGIKMPFASAFAFSMVYLQKNVFMVSLCFFLSAIIYDVSFKGLVITLCVVSVLILIYLIFKLANKKINFAAALIGCIFSQSGYLYYHLISPMNVVITIAVVILLLMFLYVTSQTFNAIFNRGLQSRFTIDENVCLSIFLIAFFSGLGNLYLFNINITNTIAVCVVLFASRVLSKTHTMYLSQLMGVGVSVCLGNVVNIAVYVSWALICVALKDKHKIFSIAGVIIVDLIFGYFFNVYAYYSYINVLSIAAVSLIFGFLPLSIFYKIKGYSYEYEGSLADEFVVAGQKILLKNKLANISKLFTDIQNAYRNLSVGELGKENVIKVLTDDVVSKYCKNCPNYLKCFEKETIKTSIIQLFEFGLEKDKVSIIDANNLITQECRRLTGLINEINNSLDNFRDYEKSIKSEDKNKIIISEQFAGTSSILKELSDFVVCGEKINYKTSKLLMDELTLNNIVVNEVMVLENDNGVERIVLIIRNIDALSENIQTSLKAVFKINFTLEVCKMTRYAGWSVLSFSPAPKYEISIGLACSSKTEKNISGDNYSFVNLGNNKVLVAISDGMGHGKRANEISDIALNLIENFYQAGFSSEVILSSVNRILLPAGEDNFTTLDACVFDKNNATVDFIKIGATCSVIKSGGISKLITQDSLPLGIMESIKISTQKCILKDKDIVILASDGVVDSFSSFEEYLNYVNNERVINVQMLASSILEEAENRDLSKRDDKTVITFKVSYKV